MLKSTSNTPTFGDVESFSYEKDIERLLEASLEEELPLTFTYVINQKLNNTYKVEFLDNQFIVTTSSKTFQSLALYSYLHELGFRFYGPEDHWTYVPKLSKKDLQQTVTQTIPFRINRLFASHGFGPNKLKSQKETKYLWDRWNARLRYGKRDRDLTFGHYGSKFNRTYKDEIIAHPDWRPKRNGKPMKYSPSMKLCFTHPEVIALYKKDAELRLRESMQKRNPPYFVTVEPSDGGKHCNDASPSNAIFTLANEVAKHLLTIHPDANVNLNAYHQHALPPDFELEKNVYVSVVPNGFQTFMPSDELLTAWMNKTDNILYRGYIAYTASNFDMPYIDATNRYVELIQTLKNNHSYGYNFEISPSLFSTGWIMYAISEATFEDEFNHKKERELFHQRMFGEKQEEISTILTLLSNEKSFLFLPTIREELTQLIQTEQDELRQKRLKDIYTYATYLQAYDGYKNRKTVSFNELMNTVYADNGKLNIHSWGLYKMFTKKNNSIKFKDEQVQLPTLTTNQTLNVSTDLDKLKQQITNNWQPINPNWSSNDKEKVVTIRKKFVGEFYNAVPNTSFNINIQASSNKKVNNAGEIVLKKDGDEISRQTITYAGKYITYEFLLEDVGLYQLSTSKLKGDAKIIVPNQPFAFKSNLNDLRSKTKQEFYFASLQNDLLFDFPSNVGPVTITDTETNKQLYVYKSKRNKPFEKLISGFEKGKIYKISLYRNSFMIKNQPFYISTHPEAVFYAK